MRHTTTRLSMLMLATTALAAPAAAQITAEDVWSNTGAALAALGGTQQAVISRNGDRVTFADVRGSFELPMGAGRITYSYSDFEMIEADGAVTIVYPSPLEMRIGAEIEGEGEAWADMIATSDTMLTTATGTPGAISYTSDMGAFEVELTDFAFPGSEGYEAELWVGMDYARSETRVIEDTLTVIYSRSEVGTTRSAFEFTDGAGLFSQSTSRADPVISTMNMGLIPGGADILNLSAALRDGMYITAESTGGSSDSQSVTMFDGRVVTEQDVSLQSSDFTFSLDKTAIAMSGEAGPMLMNLIQMGMTPGSIGFDATAFGTSFQMPLLSSEAPQDFGFALNIDDLRLGPSIWDLFDPGKDLPRSPWSLNFDVAGQMVLGADLPDLLAIAELGGNQQVPIEVTQIDIRRLAAAALGVTADSSGTFELSDEFQSLVPGVPWPAGEGRAEVQGLNTTLDRLIDQGIIGSEEAFGLRMLISLGMVVDGDDRLVTEIQLTEDGSIFANGQQLR